jgi:hypothetical protein
VFPYGQEASMSLLDRVPLYDPADFTPAERLQLAGRCLAARHSREHAALARRCVASVLDERGIAWLVNDLRTAVALRTIAEARAETLRGLADEITSYRASQAWRSDPRWPS